MRDAELAGDTELARDEAHATDVEAIADTDDEIHDEAAVDTDREVDEAVVAADGEVRDEAVVDTEDEVDEEAAAGVVDGTVVGTAVVDGVVVEGHGDQTAADLAATDTCAEPESDAGPAEVVDDAVVAGVVAGAVASGMRPGVAAPVGVVAPHAPSAADAAEVAERWQRIQIGFIDDPRGAADAARELVGGAIEARIEALREQQRALDGWQSHDTPDTEVLRAAVRGYRDVHAELQ
jgi:hypothetical protein